ncbi:hypothetical protein ACM01_46810 [Streptomyces viridochromogenes]|uniref:Uncharacterized protein n=1 Tax=Streptomyces viridochromogenes TaxID=1938 RepID=A0A0J7YQK2_STRVR|nr:hypothetical protein ACM01_46810 [Streptomyces viridochromogenes]
MVIGVSEIDAGRPPGRVNPATFSMISRSATPRPAVILAGAQSMSLSATVNTDMAEVPLSA